MITTKKSENYDPNIMRAVFEKFLEKPDFYINDDTSTMDRFKEFFNELSSFDSRLVRWHFAVLIDEYVIDRTLFGLVFRDVPKKEPIDYLNRSGQELYDKLKTRHNQVKY